MDRPHKRLPTTLYSKFQESHIEANVPDESRFAAFMQRDLEEYFSDDYGKKKSLSSGSFCGKGLPKAVLPTLNITSGLKFMRVKSS